jgi:pSer/pThr/pTyr-binding forkhead associated (FHA) protein
MAPVSNAPPVPLADRGSLWLIPVISGLESLRVDLSGTDGLVIGRSDARSTFVPDIDLVIYNALERGVSRRHATLVRYQGTLHVIDLNSVNGTLLNSKRLQADVPYPLHNGDTLKLGELTMTLSSPTE